MLRRIILSKQHFVKSDKKNMEFLCFGNSNNVIITSEYSLNDIYNQDLKNSLNNHFLIIYTKDDDKTFWNNAMQDQFVFVSFIRCSTGNRENIKNSTTHHFYDSLDVYDEVVVSHSDKFKDLKNNFELVKERGVKEINTLVLIPQSRINDGKVSGCIDMVSIRFRLKNKSKFHFIDERIKKIRNIQKYVRTGNYDLEYLINDMEVKDLISLYKNDETGIFQNSFEGETRLHHAVGEHEVRLYNKDDSNDVIPDTLFENTTGLKKEEMAISDDVKSLVKKEMAISVDVKSLVNGKIDLQDLQKVLSFFNESVADNYLNDAYLIMYGLLKEYLNKINNNKCSYETIEDSYDNLSSALMDILEIYNYSRLYSIRGVSFQGERLILPIKMLTFYSSFMWMVKKLLLLVQKKDKTHNYYFILVPTKIDNLILKNLFHDDDHENRILLTEVPCSYFFNPHNMMFQLVHEISHYVSHDLRLRKKRATYVWKAIDIYLVDYIFGNNLKQNNNVIRIFRDTLDTQLKKLSASRDKEEELYTQTVKSIIVNVIQELINILPDKLALEKDDECYKICYEKKSSKDKRHQLDELERKYININRRFIDLEVSRCYIKELDDIFYYCNECFCDLIALYLLDVKFEEYCQILQEVSNRQMGKMINEFLVIRISIIMIVCKAEYSKNDSIKPYVDNIVDSYYKVIKNEETVLNEDSILDKFGSPVKLAYIVKYIYECNENLQRCMHVKKCSKIKEIRAVYHDLQQSKNVDLTLFYKCINDFKYSILKNMSA